MKLCEECFCRTANIHLMQITGSTQQSVFLCEECAKKHGISISLENGSDDRHSFEPEPDEPGMERECSGCGMKFSEYAETGRLGCPSCYAAFEPEITTLQQRFDDTQEYRGKRHGQETASHEHTAQDDLLALQHELDNAIRNEQFERAAFLRDAINHLDEAGKE